MLFLQRISFTFWCFILGVFTDPPSSSILDKFMQSDYKVKFERTDVASYDKRMMKTMEIVTFKYNRTTTVINATIEFNVDASRTLEGVVQVFKFVSNEYRLFPIHFQLNICEAITKNIVGAGNFCKCGNLRGCGFDKGKRVRICNWSPDESRFPPFIPNGRYMLEVQLLVGNTEAAILKAYIEVHRPIEIPN